MQPSRKGALLVLFCMLIVCGLPLLASAEIKPTWEVPFDSEVKWITLTPTGQLLVTTDKSLTGINADSGNILWKLDESVGPASAFTPTGQMLMILNKTLVSFNPENGSINWRREGLDGANVSLLTVFTELPYALMFIDTTYQVQDNMSRAQTDIARTRIITFDYTTGKEVCNTDSLGIFSTMGIVRYLSPNSSVLFFGEEEGKGYRVTAVDLASGTRLWENKDFFRGNKPDLFRTNIGNKTISETQPQLFDSDETMIVFMDEGAMRKWNTRTGQLIWETALGAKRAPAPYYGFTAMVLGEKKDVVYTPCDNFLYAVNTQDGHIIWKSPKLEGIVHDIIPVAEGILISTGLDYKLKGAPSITILDPLTGNPLWKKPFTKMKHWDFVVKDEQIIVLSDNKLYTLDRHSGVYSVLVANLGFGGGERPYSLTLRDNGYFLQSNQNLMYIDEKGSQVFRAYYAVPKATILSKVAAFTGNVMLSTMVSVAGAYSAGGGSLGGYGGGSSPIMAFHAPQYGATKHGQNFTYMLAKIKPAESEDVGLVKVNRLTGKTEAEIILDDLRPLYLPDEGKSRLYYVNDKENKNNKVVCYPF